MIFVKTKKDGELRTYIFKNKKSGEIKTVEQFY